jgi:Coenzyme PQQ synthesis protein D (PqqD)
MVDLDMSFAVNEVDVIAESIHGETLIINLNSGAYYTAGQTGDEIWRALSQGVTVRQLIDNLGLKYPEEQDTLADDVLAFVEDLRRENLLEVAHTPAVKSGLLETAPVANGQYARPTLDKYTDFQELLMLDPIHQVHAVHGWPSPKPAD